MIQTDSSLKFRIHMILNKIFKCSVKEGNNIQNRIFLYYGIERNGR